MSVSPRERASLPARALPPAHKSSSGWRIEAARTGEGRRVSQPPASSDDRVDAARDG